MSTNTIEIEKRRYAGARAGRAAESQVRQEGQGCEESQTHQKDVVGEEGWQAHGRAHEQESRSEAHGPRGFVSILGSKGGEKVESSKNAAGDRVYKLVK